jgi:hypothetical protein
LQNLSEARDITKKGMQEAISLEALEMLAESRPLVPVKYGRLRNSGYAKPARSIENPVAQVGYGTDYAVPVHERTEVHHEVGQALFLKVVVDRRERGYVDRLAERVRRYERTGSVGAKPPAPEEPSE